MADMSEELWNAAVGPDEYSTDTEKYRSAILSQYQICVEMADRVSSRRNLTNTFFLSLNSAVVALLAGMSGESLLRLSLWVAMAGLLILLTQCMTWFVMVRSYRQLNAAKYEVIGALEERLPAYAYSRAEWRALGEGRDWHVYVPLTYVEQWVPLVFGAAYLVGFLAIAV